MSLSNVCYGAMFDREATARFEEKQQKLVSILRQPAHEKDAEADPHFSP